MRGKRLCGGAAHLWLPVPGSHVRVALQCGPLPVLSPLENYCVCVQQDAVLHSTKVHHSGSSNRGRLRGELLGRPWKLDSTIYYVTLMAWHSETIKELPCLAY